MEYDDAVIFAGGRGERLKPASNNLNKNLFPAGKQPIISHLLDMLAKLQVKRVFLLLNYRINDFNELLIEQAEKNSLEIVIVSNNSCCPLHALKQLEDKNISERFVLLHGNILFPFAHLKNVMNLHSTNENTLCVSGTSTNHNIDTHPYSASLNGKVTKIVLEKPKKSYNWHCWMGVYSFSSQIFKLLNTYPSCGVPENAIKESINLYTILEIVHKDYWFHLENMDDAILASKMDTSWIWKSE